MSEALEEHECTVMIGGRTISNLRFADDIDGVAGTEAELTKLVDQLNNASNNYGMEISTAKTKLMTNCSDGLSGNPIKIDGEDVLIMTEDDILGIID